MLGIDTTICEDMISDCNAGKYTANNDVELSEKRRPLQQVEEKRTSRKELQAMQLDVSLFIGHNNSLPDMTD